MLACYVICLIKRAGIATLRQPSCKRHTFPKSSSRLDPKPASFAKFCSSQATRAQLPRCCGGGGVRHTQELTNDKRLRCPAWTLQRHSAAFEHQRLSSCATLTPQQHASNSPGCFASSRTALMSSRCGRFSKLGDACG